MDVFGVQQNSRPFGVTNRCRNVLEEQLPLRVYSLP